MTSTTPAPLVFFHVLADRRGTPSGLLIDLGAGDSSALLPSFFESAAFHALADQIPCFYRADHPAALAQALSQQRWSEIMPWTLVRVDELLVQDMLPPEAQWIDGDWCMAPPAKAPGAQAASRALALQLVQLVATDADTHEIEALLRHDPALSYQLLRLVNSLGVGAGRRVTSFAQAILILGRQQLRRWLNLMLFAAREGDVRSAMLLARVAVRARAIELLARSRGLDKNTQEQGFMTGMFSLLGVLFGMPLAEVLAPLSIGEAMQAALLKREGELGELLRLLETAERGELDRVAAQLESLQISSAEFNDAVVDANQWMLGAVRENQGKANA